jgi:hypothetical protein
LYRSANTEEKKQTSTFLLVFFFLHWGKFKFNFKKLYRPNKIAFLSGEFSFAAQWWG